MFADLDAADASAAHTDSDGFDTRRAREHPGRRSARRGRRPGRHIVAAVFDCAVTDFENDDMLDDIGLDSMMAMDFRVRINTTFSIDLPVLEILGASA